MGSEVLKLRAWAETEATEGGRGDRDSAPRHADRLWRQVSVSHRECLGAARCPFGTECFAERAKERAAQSQLIVTNHSLLAIDAIEGVPMIPDYGVVVIDEAHELSARVTQAATDDLTPPRSSVPPVGPRVTSAAPRPTTSPRRPTGSPTPCWTPSRGGSTRSRPRWPTRWSWSATRPGPCCPGSARTPGTTPACTQAKGGVQEVFVDRRADGGRGGVRRALGDRA